MLPIQPASTATRSATRGTTPPAEATSLPEFGVRRALAALTCPGAPGCCFCWAVAVAVSVGPLLLLFSLRRYRSIEVSCSWRTTRRRRGMVCRVRRRFATCESGESSPHSKGFAPAPPHQLNALPTDLASRNDSPTARRNMLAKQPASTATRSATRGTTPPAIKGS